MSREYLADRLNRAARVTLVRGYDEGLLDKRLLDLPIRRVQLLVVDNGPTRREIRLGGGK